MKRATAIFLVAVILQVLILVGVPARKAYTRATGRGVVLKVAPVDPYSILSGYYVILDYDISRPASYPNGPKFESGEVIYAIVEQQADGLWKPVGIDRAFPKNLPGNRVAMRGRWNEWRIEYGIEEFYIPEEKRTVIADDLGKNQNEARVEVKVDAQGNAALVRLRIQDRVYE
jgi:uncharacterized membrane-anchored protein